MTLKLYDLLNVRVRIQMEELIEMKYFLFFYRKRKRNILIEKRSTRER